MKYFISAIMDYSNFSGRARRSEYWYFVLFNIIFGVAAMIMDSALGSTFSIDMPGAENISLPYGYIYLAYSVFIILPALAVWVRRLHDVGKSGWFLLIAIIPIIGGIWLLVLALKDSQPGENQYGPNPKGVNFNF
jgi:uncharacterized membrane protein YhaH (DUF805 family)